MVPGRIMEHNQHAARNCYLCVFARGGDDTPDVSGAFSGKPQSKGRAVLTAFVCEKCGFTELYSREVG
jgi:hypothetical protein